MPARKRSWAEKLNDAKGLPKVGRITGKMAGRWGSKEGDTLVVPAPLEVDALMKKVPRGKLVTINELRIALARQHDTTMACPITTGIFAWIVAHAAEEARAGGSRKITPYWRTLKAGGEINPKYPGGIPAIRKLLAAEGHKVVRKGARSFVADYQRALAALV